MLSFSFSEIYVQVVSPLQDKVVTTHVLLQMLKMILLAMWYLIKNYFKKYYLQEYIFLNFFSFQKTQNCSQLWDQKITWEKLFFKITSNASNCKCWIWCEWHWGLLFVMLIQETAHLRFQTKWHQHCLLTLFSIIFIWVNIFIYH
jgi:hypothetical protein